MKLFAPIVAFVLCAPVAAPAPADVVLTRKVHSEGGPGGAQDSVQVVWIGKDRMRVETEARVAIVRLDQQKMHLLDPKTKSASTIDLPYDMRKYVPADRAALATQIRGANSVTATVVATDETKKIGAWNTRKFTLEVANAQAPVERVELWTTSDLPLDARAYLEMTRLLTAVRPGAEAVAEEMKKLEGVPVLTERTRPAGASTITIREELASVETKDAPAGTFDVPADYTVSPFDPLVEIRARQKPPVAGK